MVWPQGLTASACSEIFLSTTCASEPLVSWWQIQDPFLAAADNEGLIRPWQSQMMSKGNRSIEDRQIRAMLLWQAFNSWNQEWEAGQPRSLASVLKPPMLSVSDMVWCLCVLSLPKPQIFSICCSRLIQNSSGFARVEPFFHINYCRKGKVQKDFLQLSTWHSISCISNQPPPGASEPWQSLHSSFQKHLELFCCFSLVFKTLFWELWRDRGDQMELES